MCPCDSALWRDALALTLVPSRLIVPSLSSLSYVYVQWDSAPKRSPNYRVINQTSTMVVGQSESAVIQKLRTLFPSHQDFVIRKLEWK